MKITNSMVAAMKGYGVTVDQLEKEEFAYKGKIKTDFKKMLDDLEIVRKAWDTQDDIRNLR